jgi:Raf kinase inhibitor-like YbhB/YbcL family protein
MDQGPWGIILGNYPQSSRLNSELDMDGKKMRRLILFVLLLLSVFLVPFVKAQEASKGGGLKLSSPAFENNGYIPSKYTCDGANVNPPLKIENVPQGTKSLAMIFDDVDAPRGSYVHWILWNIDPTIKEIKENSVPEGAVQGMNDFKKQNYGGPCPPGRAHRYVFKIFALDIRLNPDPSSTKADLEKGMKGHVMVQAQLMGVYKRVSASQNK